MNPVSFHFKSANSLASSGFDGLKLSDGRQFGFIAQEIEKVLPEIVSIEGFATPTNSNLQNQADGAVKIPQFKVVDSIQLIPILVKAIQEQQERIEDLETQIKSLESNQ